MQPDVSNIACEKYKPTKGKSNSAVDSHIYLNIW